MKKLLILAIMLITGTVMNAQCVKFSDSDLGEEGLDAYSIYMQSIKSKDWTLALEQWEIAYKIAPAADGRRDHNFSKGIEILTEFYKLEQDNDKKKAYLDRINKLNDEMIACYEAKGISVKGCNNDDCLQVKIGKILGEQGYNMFYNLNAPYASNLEVLDASVDKAGLNSSYGIFIPYATIAVYQFEKGKIDAEKARSIHQKLIEISEHNVANKHKYAKYYADGKLNADNLFKRIEGQIYDCAYFIAKLKVSYEADPDNLENLRFAIARLKKQNCPTDDPFYMMLDKKWKVYASEENAKIQADFEAKNPGVAARRLYEAGKYKEAVAKYNEALSSETDPSKQASYLFGIASIQFRKLKQYNTARTTARRAAKLKPGWGKPYLLIGDMYATTARSCGNDWSQRLAILAAIDKYAYAKSIDGEASAEANKKIGRYNASKPTKEEGFMRKVKPGQTVKVGCWIGESVKVRFK